MSRSKSSYPQIVCASRHPPRHLEAGGLEVLRLRGWLFANCLIHPGVILVCLGGCWVVLGILVSMSEVSGRILGGSAFPRLGDSVPSLSRLWKPYDLKIRFSAILGSISSHTVSIFKSYGFHFKSYGFHFKSYNFHFRYHGWYCFYAMLTPLSSLSQLNNWRDNQPRSLKTSKLPASKPPASKCLGG